jgi:long-chain acyl-CoA synthetase
LGVQTDYIHDLIFAAAEKYPYRPAIWRRENDRLVSISYSEFVTQIMNVAAGLRDLGVREGCHVGIYSENRPEWPVAYLAILAAGGVVVPIDRQSKIFELRSLIGRGKLDYLFCSVSSIENLSELVALAPPHPLLICLDNDSPTEVTLARLTELGEGENIAKARHDPGRLATLIFTSGTQGESKAVMLTHRNILADIEACTKRLTIYPEDRLLSVLPLHHTFETTAGFLFPLSRGASIAYARSLKSANILRDIQDFQVTLMCAVPLLFEKMSLKIKRALAQASSLQRAYVRSGFAVGGMLRPLGLSTGRSIFAPLRRKAGLSSLRLLVSGGAAINPEVSRFFCDLGIDLLQGYGLSETSPVLSVNANKGNRYASVGRPLDGVEVRIVSADSNGVGEIAVRGEMIMSGYFENEAATRAAIREGWFYTGDLGYLDGDGFLYITGRAKNVIVTAAGKNIYPEEIETALENSPFILESAVLPRKRGSGEEPVAVVVPDYETIAVERPDLPETEIDNLVIDEVKHISAQLTEYKRIKQVFIEKEELPKTSTRKVKKYVLLDRLRKKGAL